MSCSTMTTVLPRSVTARRSRPIMLTAWAMSRLFSGSSSRMKGVSWHSTMAM